MSTLVLLRHGESTWNKENRFTGWVDVDLSPRGVEEARAAGAAMVEAGTPVDVAHTSLQRRAIRTMFLTLDVLDRLWVPVRRSWRLNERHYGALQGLDKSDVAARYGEEQFLAWRRSYDVPPPPLAADDPGHPRFDPRYRHLAPDVLPATECLKDVVARMLPYWHDAIVPDLRAGRAVLVAAHGNSLRGLVKHLEGVSDADIVSLNVPTGFPRVYELDEDLRPAGPAQYLPDDDTAMAAAAQVARQGAAPPPA